jgi:hypothetical protein
LIEPEAPKIDCAALGSVKSHGSDPTDFPIRSDGVRRINLRLARAAATVSTPRLEASTDENPSGGSSRSRPVRPFWL